MTKPSIDGLISWLETKDPNGTYNFSKCDGTCLFAQYMLAIGIPWVSSKYPPTPYIYTLQLVGNDVAPGAWYQGNVQQVASESPQTFGAALERAKAFRSERKPLPNEIINLLGVKPSKELISVD